MAKGVAIRPAHLPYGQVVCSTRVSVGFRQALGSPLLGSFLGTRLKNPRMVLGNRLVDLYRFLLIKCRVNAPPLLR